MGPGKLELYRRDEYNEDAGGDGGWKQSECIKTEGGTRRSTE